MYRLIAIMTFILMYINLNESKPLIYDDIWSNKVDFPIDRLDLINIPLSVEQNSMNTERNKRNCFLYAMKLQNRASKWMCW